MTARREADDTCASGHRIEIDCDICGVKAPPAEAIMKAHGLMNLGWYCSGGTHICPAHPHPTEGRFAKGKQDAKA
jgi:hypothetical protein